MIAKRRHTEHLRAVWTLLPIISKHWSTQWKIVLHKISVYPLCTWKLNGIHREKHRVLSSLFCYGIRNPNRDPSQTMMSSQRKIAPVGLSWEWHESISGSNKSQRPALDMPIFGWYKCQCIRVRTESSLELSITIDMFFHDAEYFFCKIVIYCSVW